MAMHKQKSNKGKKKKVAPKKGVAGKKTGPSAKEAIKSARSKGASTTQIARAAKRSTSVITAIERGDIKNPPSDLDNNIRKIKKGGNK